MTNFLSYITVAFQQLVKNKGRSVLTMLGIIIGIGSVIFIITTGEVAKRFLLAQLSQFGTNVIEIAPAGSFTGSTSGLAELKAQDVDILQNSDLLPEITAVSGGRTVTTTLTSADGQAETVTVYGDNPSIFTVNQLDVLAGRLFTQADVASSARSLVMDEVLAKDLYASASAALGKRVKISGTVFTIIGVVKSISAGPAGFIPVAVYTPLTTLNAELGAPASHNMIDYLIVEFTPGSDSESIKQRIDFELRQAHNVQNTEGDVFLILSRDQFLSIFNQILLGIQLFISAVAGISLLVGGIGIMNIMLVTVNERTKEIGLRKAIGAKRASIMGQFLTEAAVLTTVGGVVGIVIGLGSVYAAVVAVNIFQPDWGLTFVVVPSAIVLACGVAMVVGIVFGLYPAVKAARLHPVEALRYE